MISSFSKYSSPISFPPKASLLLWLGLFFCGFSQAFSQDTIRTYYDEESLAVKEVFVKIKGKAQGEVKLYDPQGKLIVIGHLKDDKKTGPFYDLDPETGDTLRIITYQENLRQGKSQSFYPGGQLSQESYFENNLLEGTLTSYFEDGSVQDRIQFKNNKPEGLSETYYPNGSPKSKISFLAGQYHGVNEQYDEEGNLTSQTNYAKGVLHGPDTQYFPDGSIKSTRNFLSGELDGEYRVFFPNGKIERQGFYKRGLPEGEMLEFFPDGSKKMEANYSKGNPSQPTVYFYENGQVRQRAFFDSSGRKLREENFYPSGKLYSVIPFQNGLEQGEVKILFEDGSPKEIRTYNRGRLDGLQEWYDETGKLVKSEFYENGIIVKK